MTGEDLYHLHRQEQVRLGMLVDLAYGNKRQPLFWHELPERQRMAWDGTARQVTEQMRRQQAAIQAASYRDPSIYGTPRVTDGMLSRQPQAGEGELMHIPV